MDVDNFVPLCTGCGGFGRQSRPDPSHTRDTGQGPLRVAARRLGVTDATQPWRRPRPACSQVRSAPRASPRAAKCAAPRAHPRVQRPALGDHRREPASWESRGMAPACLRTVSAGLRSRRTSLLVDSLNKSARQPSIPRASSREQARFAMASCVSRTPPNPRLAQSSHG